jgi:hypothetical protein
MSLSIQRTAGPPKSLFGQFGGFAIPGIGPLVVQSPFLTALVSLIPPLPTVPPIVRGTITSLLMLRGFSEEAKYIKVATTDPVTGKPKAPNVFTDPATNASWRPNCRAPDTSSSPMTRRWSSPSRRITPATSWPR